MDHNKNENPQFKQGYLYAIRLLTASKKSTKEIRKRLHDKGYDPTIAEQVLDSLKNQGILNDGKVVEETIHWAKHAKRYGKKRIALELKRKGFDQSLIETALQQFPLEDERKIAYELAQTRWDKLGNLEVLKRKKRLFSYLISRGFDFGLSREIIDELNRKKDYENFAN